MCHTVHFLVNQLAVKHTENHLVPVGYFIQKSIVTYSNRPQHLYVAITLYQELDEHDFYCPYTYCPYTKLVEKEHNMVPKKGLNMT